MAAFDHILAIIALLAFVAGCVILHIRIRNAASAVLVVSVVLCTAWAWLDQQIPRWMTGPAPMNEALLSALFNSAVYAEAIIYFTLCVSFLATCLSLPKRQSTARPDV